MTDTWSKQWFSIIGKMKNIKPPPKKNWTGSPYAFHRKSDALSIACFVWQENSASKGISHEMKWFLKCSMPTIISNRNSASRKTEASILWEISSLWEWESHCSITKMSKKRLRSCSGKKRDYRFPKGMSPSLLQGSFHESDNWSKMKYPWSLLFRFTRQIRNYAISSCRSPKHIRLMSSPKRSATMWKHQTIGFSMNTSWSKIWPTNLN